MEGEYPETVIADEDYTSRTNKGFFYDYLNKKMDNVFLITSVGSYTLIPHFEIEESNMASKIFHFPSFSIVKVMISK